MNRTRSLIAGILAFLLILAGLAALRGELIALAIPLLVYLLAGLLRGPQSLALKVERTLSAERVLPGQKVDVKLVITNTGDAHEDLLFEDLISPRLTVVDGASKRMFTLKRGQTITWTYTISGQRGCYPINQLHASTKDRLGLVTLEETIITPGSQLFILPTVTRIRNIAIRPRTTRVYAGSIPARTGGSGTEFFGVREYQPGDSLHWVNWHASARHEQDLFTNEFEQERVSDVGILLDGRTSANEFGGQNTIFEHSVRAAASLSDAFLTAGNRVGLFVYGKYLNWTYPGYGKLQREKILQTLARAELGESEVFSGLVIPKQLFPQHSQMVIISPLKKDDLESIIQFHSAGYQLLIVSPDPVSYELALLPQIKSVQTAARIINLERALLLQRIQRGGIQVVNWDVNKPFEHVVGAALSRPPAWQRAIRAGGGA